MVSGERERVSEANESINEWEQKFLALSQL